ncbi:gfo/Idh/MocA family oxidoreductase, partial [bacterium]|nr:gfo/Idh/MocA family oxidoreductase [bacterium]
INWAQHHYDIVQWALDADRTGPVQVGFEEGKLAWRFASGVVVYGAPYPGERVGGSGGATFVGTKGRIAVDRENLVSHPASILETPLGVADTHLYHSISHSGNFLECVRTRARTLCDVKTAHRAISIVLLGDITMRLRRNLKWDPEKEKFIGDDEANRLCSIAKRPPWRI